jgi:leader peptidase (prepilin peptidase) / N-methyltransferase
MNTIILVFAALFGACVGSFLNVCIFRLPRRCLRLWKPKLSFCPQCRRTLEWWENIPVLGYIFLAGKCRTCRASIPLRYFFVELGTACMFLYLAGRELAVENSNAPLFVVHALLGSAFIVCALVDWDHKMIPDEIDIPGFLLAPFVVFFVPSVLGENVIALPRLASNACVYLDSALPWWGLSDGATATITGPLRALHDAALRSTWGLAFSAAFTSVVGAAAGAGLVWFIGWAGRKIFKADAMGFGDVKLMAMIGGFLGWQGVLYSMVLACVAGSIYGISHKFRTGRNTITGRDLLRTPATPVNPPMPQTPFAYLALRLFGAPKPPRGYKQVREFVRAKLMHAPIPLRFGGRLAARFATGDNYLPFGPFLILGALVCALWPDAIHGALMWWSETVASRFRLR